MAAEYVYNEVQTLAPNGNVLFNGSIPCRKGNVLHREGSGIFTLTSRNVACNCCFARYRVSFNGNIAIPADGTAGPLAVALAINGEPILTSRAIATDGAAGRFFNVTSTAIIDIPKGCCQNVSVQNVSPDNEGTAPVAIEVQNANIVFDRIA